MIKNVIFDIGKVLVEYNWDSLFMSRFGSNRELVDRIKRALFGDDIWAEVDRGVWSDDRILSEFISRDPELHNEINKAWGYMSEEIKQSSFTKPWIRDLHRRGYRVYYLSNWSFRFLDECKEALDFIQLMDGGVFSCDVKQIKPEEAIYRTIVEKYDLVPEECVFLDDKAANIDAAISFGFKGIVVHNHDQAAAELELILKN